jgi:hypothetical protein
LGPDVCINGDAGDFPCSGVTLRKRVSIESMDGIGDNVSDLDAPVYIFANEASTFAIDHNLYVVGNRVSQANYESGSRVLEFGSLANQELVEIAFFVTYPTNIPGGFPGAWSV